MAYYKINFFSVIPISSIGVSPFLAKIYSSLYIESIKCSLVYYSHAYFHNSPIFLKKSWFFWYFKFFERLLSKPFSRLKYKNTVFAKFIFSENWRNLFCFRKLGKSLNKSPWTIFGNFQENNILAINNLKLFLSDFKFSIKNMKRLSYLFLIWNNKRESFRVESFKISSINFESKA